VAVTQGTYGSMTEYWLEDDPAAGPVLCGAIEVRA